MRTTALLTVLISILLTASCGGNDNTTSNKKAAQPTAKPIKIQEADLSAAVGTPQGNASFVANMVAQCIAKAATATDCNDSNKVASFNPSYKATLELGDKPGGTTVQVDAADSFSATARSVDVAGVGVTEWTYFKKPGDSEYQSRCTPEIVEYCVKGTITPYNG